MTSHRKDDHTINIASHIPSEADFLMVYSTMPGNILFNIKLHRYLSFLGYYAWRNSLKGSWFIQALCEMLTKYGSKWDLLRILTKVNRRVAMDYQSNCSDAYMNQRQQIPVFVSTLTKDVKFLPKPY
jgi:hypothetical protein